jgi:hypothetical protein
VTAAEPPSAPFGSGQAKGVAPKPAVRDKSGRFIKGNPGGPGNPFARRVAELRTALLEAATPERMRRLRRALFAQALAGDTAAALVLKYTLVGPLPDKDPDRCDLDEFRDILASPTVHRGLQFGTDGFLDGQVDGDVVADVLGDVAGDEVQVFVAEQGASSWCWARVS